MKSTKTNKGQAMSLNTIIIAALVILVLVVLSVIFIRNSGKFSDSVASCEVQGGICAPSCGDAAYGTEAHTITRYDIQCDDQIKNTCCIKG